MIEKNRYIGSSLGIKVKETTRSLVESGLFNVPSVYREVR